MKLSQCRPWDDASWKAILGDVIEAHDNLQAKRKLSLIIKLRSTREISVDILDMIEVFSKKGVDNVFPWSTSVIVLALGFAALTALVVAKGGKRTIVAFKKIHLTLLTDCFRNAL